MICNTKNFKKQLIISFKINESYKEFDFFNIQNNFDEEENEKTFTNIMNSNSIIIHRINDNHHKDSFIVCFKNTLIIVHENSINYIDNLLKSNKEIIFYFDEIANNKFKNYKFKISKSTSSNFRNILQHQLSNHITILENPTEISSELIRPVISKYLIEDSYIQSSKRPYKMKIFNPIEIKKEDYVILKMLNYGSDFYINLIYYIEDDSLLIIKSLIKDQSQYLIDREYENYLHLKHPQISKLVGKINKDKKSIVIEYINANTIFSLIDQESENKNQFSFKYNKFSILLQIMLIVEYIHLNKYVMRDVNPNNLMIDKKNNVILIDLCEMILHDMIEKKEIHTNDFSSPFICPETNTPNYSYESDIYSLGKVIYFIINEQIPFDDIKFQNEYKLYDLCFKKTMEKRPSISKLINSTLMLYHENIDSSELNDLFNINAKFASQQYFSKYEKDVYFLNVIISIKLRSIIYKMIDFYYSINIDDQIKLGSAFIEELENISNPENYVLFLKNIIDFVDTIIKIQKDEKKVAPLQYLLGRIYLNKKFQNIDKSIEHLEKAANQQYAEAQYLLGLIYVSFKNNIHLAINYFKAAAEKGHSNSQFFVGIYYIKFHNCQFYINLFDKIPFYNIYYDLDFKSTIKSVIYYEEEINKQKGESYLTYASNANNMNAIIILIYVLLANPYFVRDQIKAFSFLNHAANNLKNSSAQCLVGLYYMNGDSVINKCIQKNEKEAERYLKLSADQSDPNGQCYLGLLYLRQGKIDQAIYYLTLASCQNQPDAHNNLGIIYSNESDKQYNMNIAVEYYKKGALCNVKQSQYNLGLLYINGQYINKNPQNGILYLKEAAKNDFLQAKYALGCLYFEGKYINRSIIKAKDCFLYGSNQKDPYSKNNLGIIHLKCYDRSHLNYAIEYFNDGIKLNDPLCRYNLAKIYIYDDNSTDYDLAKAVSYLLCIIDFDFDVFTDLFCIGLIKKYKNQINTKNVNMCKQLMGSNYFYQRLENIVAKNEFEKLYMEYKEVDLLYNINYDIIQINDIFDNKNKTINSDRKKNINNQFYEGFK